MTLRNDQIQESRLEYLARCQKGRALTVLLTSWRQLDFNLNLLLLGMQKINTTKTLKNYKGLTLRILVKKTSSGVSEFTCKFEASPKK